MIHRVTGRHLALLVTAILALTALIPAAATHAQDTAVTITLAVQDNERDTYNAVVKDFEAANPGVTVQLATQTQSNIGAAANDVSAHLDGVQQLVSQSDVVLVRSTDVSAEGTRAGYFLNLQPLIDSDSALNAADFFPSIFRAFQWDQGTWALPLSASPVILTYDPAAFDKAHVTYPTAQWTLDDLIAAVKALTVVDASGKIVTPGIELFQGNNDIPLYMSLIGKPLADLNAIPNPPNIDQPETTKLLDGLVTLFQTVPSQSATNNQAPIRIQGFQQLLFGGGPGGGGGGNNASTRKGVLLPGGHSYLNVSGVAVSAATQYPDKAYALAKFLTTRTDIAGRGLAYPARQSLVTGAASGGTGGTGAIPGPGGFNIAAILARLVPDQRQLLTDAINVGYSTTDRRFYDFLGSAIRKATGTGTLDTKTAMATAQSEALNAEQVALTRKADASKVAVVATPVPTVAPNAGITLKFGMSGFGNAIPKKAEILALADQFVKDNAGVVGRVDVEQIGGGFGGNAATTGASSFDCFYLPYSAVPNLALDTVIALDPYLTADKTYDQKDYVAAALNQAQRDNKIWALPMNIAPTVMWYDPLAFGNAGATKPVAGWTIDSFKDALKTLAPTIKNNNPPFTVQGDAGSSMLMLVASYGGLPIDYRTNPITVKFTDQANVDAMQQVLDLAKNKLIDYRALAATLGIGLGLNGDPLYSQQLNGLNFGRPQRADTAAAASNYSPVTFPKGSKVQLMAFSVGTLYISATAQNADACYKWISTFAQHPELTEAMPARHSLLNDPKMDTLYGAALSATYRDVSTVLDDPNTIGAPSLIGGFTNIASIAVQHWLFQAWDNYVLNGKDLNTELQDSQKFADGFLQCAAGIPAFDPAQGKYSDYQQKFLTCATTVDPALKTQFRIGG